MNRRRFLGLLAVAPIAALLPGQAPAAAAGGPLAVKVGAIDMVTPQMDRLYDTAAWREVRRKMAADSLRAVAAISARAAQLGVTAEEWQALDYGAVRDGIPAERLRDTLDGAGMARLVDDARAAGVVLDDETIALAAQGLREIEADAEDPRDPAPEPA
jgi:hypothetical protein